MGAVRPANQVKLQPLTTKVLSFSLGQGTNGGKIDIGYATSLTVNAVPMVAGATGQNGNGGTINIHNVSGAISVQVNMDAHANGTGQGGSITLAGGSVDLTTSGIELIAGHPNGNTDTGPGGTITVTGTATVGVTAVNNNIEQLFQPWMGLSATDTSNKGGIITMNTVTCQEYLVAPATWPHTYRNCANPGSPSSTDQLVMTDVENIAGSKLNLSHDEHLWVMTTLATFNTFYNLTGMSAANVNFCSLTIPAKFVSPFTMDLYATEGCLISTTAPGTPSIQQATNNELYEIMSHELAHAYDIVNNFPSAATSYKTAYTDDMNHINAAGAPCVAGGGGPFNGVIDNTTGTWFCGTDGTGGTINDPDHVYAGQPNATIASLSTGTLPINIETEPNGTTQGWYEPFAQAFAYQYYGHSQQTFPPNPSTNPYSDTTADGLFNNGYYQCIRSAEGTLASNTFTPTYACN